MLNGHNFTNLSPTTLLERSAVAFANNTAIVFDECEFTYAELLQRCRRSAEMFRDLGVSYESKVAFIAENSLASIESHFSVPAAGGVLVSINPWLPSEDIVRQVSHSDSEIVLISSKWFSLHGELIQNNTQCQIILIDGECGSVSDELLNYEYEISRRDLSSVPLDFYIQNEMAPIAINYTSGTTGQPKGVTYSHRGAYLHAIGQVLMIDMNKRSTYFWSLPMFHVNGWGHMWSSVAVGAKQVIVSGDQVGSFDKEAIRSMCAHNVTHMAGAPRLVRSFLEAYGDDRSLRGLTILTGGAAPTPSLIKKMESLALNLIHQYGLNETCGPYVVCETQDEWGGDNIDQHINKYLRQGVASIHAGTGVRVVDENRLDVPADGKTQGEVIMQGNSVATEYYKNPEATSLSFRDGWFYSGDIAVMHDDGYLEIQDRKKDLIYVETDYGWENISSIEIENIISQCSKVDDVAIVGINLPDEDKEGQTVVCFVETEGEQTSVKALIEVHCKKYLPSYKQPSFIFFQSLPKTSTGKIKKNVLVESGITLLVEETEDSL